VFLSIKKCKFAASKNVLPVYMRLPHGAAKPLRWGDIVEFEV
jgi:hypothetical protein